MDRRQRKTRKAILDACTSLMQEKDFQKITINDIADQADINRGTFYLHFVDKYDMMDNFENEMVEKIENVIVNNLSEEQSNQLFLTSRYDTIVEILICYEENKDLLQLLLKANYFSFQTKLREKIKIALTKVFFSKFRKLEFEIPIDLFNIIFTSISLSLAEYAYESKTPINIEKLADFMFNIMLQGPAKTFGLLEDEGNNLD